MTSDRRRDVLLVAAVGLAARLGVVAWAARTIPPTADGTFYDTFAVRMAEGNGYTWLWPDGAVSYAAHYPVGYPAFLAVGYAIFGASPTIAMLFNAIVGTAAGIAVWSLVRRAASTRAALAAGLAVALHPALVPYTAALMTEGVTATLVVVAAAVAARAREASKPLRWIVLVGVAMGIATLVRPQSLLLAPALGWLAAGRWRPREERRSRLTTRFGGGPLGGAVVTLVTLAVCAPWTARNCVRMERCALVSVNGGWNLAIGAQTQSGGWQELVVPEACKTVYQEAAKDACFGREAVKSITREPMAWLARIPAKLRVTFDYFGAAPWYLHAANAERFPHAAKIALGTLETIVSRAFLAAAIVAQLRAPTSSSSRRWGFARRGVAAIGLLACVLTPGTIAYLALSVAVLMLGVRPLMRAPLVVPFTAAVVLTTAAIHAVFFGAGRYGLVVVPFVTALAFVRPRSREPVAEEPSDGAPCSS